MYMQWKIVMLLLVLYSIRNRSYAKKVRVGLITRTIGHGYAKGVKVGLITWTAGQNNGGLRPQLSLGRRADNVIIPFDLTQLFCPGFTRAAGPPSSFTTDIVGCLGGALWTACNLTAIKHSSTGPVVHPFASRHEGPRFNPQGGTYVKPGFSCWHCLATVTRLEWAIW